jgi:hypothetical protein
MARLFGKTYTREQLLRRVGDVAQVGGPRAIELQDGNQRGVRAVDCATGTGFQFTVLLDRGMDIGPASYCGKPLAWYSMAGPVHPSFYEPQGLGFLRSFHGGLLCTCGLTWCGAPCTDEGEELGLHGRASHIPARHVGMDAEWQGDDYVFSVKGSVREASVFGTNVVLTRTIRSSLGANALTVEDVVRNDGFEPAPLMLLYHINGGFPVVDKGAELIAPTRKTKPLDERAASQPDRYAVMDAPTHGVPEACTAHAMAAGRDGKVVVALVNRELDDGFGYYVEYDRRQLPHFTEWKMMGEGMYVVGTEPSTMPLMPRDQLRKRGKLECLEPGEERRVALEIGVVNSARQVRAIERRCRKALKPRRRR